MGSSIRLEELVAEVVVRGDVAARGAEPLPAVRPRPRLDEPGEPRVALAAALGVRQQELQQAHEVVRAPPALLVRLAEPHRAVRRDAREEPEVEDVEAHDRAGPEPPHAIPSGSVASSVPPSSPWKARSRSVSAEARPARRASRCAARQGVARRAHSGTEPMPGTKGGLWWNGTRFA